MTQVANFNYYMEESVLLGTKPLVDSIRHFIRDPSGVFSHMSPLWVSYRSMTSRFPPFAFVELVSPYNKKSITRWLEDMDFMFSWQEQYLTRSLRSLVRYCSYHSNINPIDSVIFLIIPACVFSTYDVDQWKLPNILWSPVLFQQHYYL